MSRSPVTTGVAAIALALLVGVGLLGAGPVPPIGPLLDPWRGLWAVAGSANRLPTGDIEIPGLEATVEVRVDHRGVPHIFASREADAALALGWLVARDRLFQLELQTRATAGTLTEWVGPVALDTDRRTRAIGLAWSADRKWAALDTNSTAYSLAVAYATGINNWIEGMSPRDLPLEYRLLNVRPARWEPKHAAYLMAQMGLTLAWTDIEQDRLRLQARVGRAAAEALLPVHSMIQEPMQPTGVGGPRRILSPVTPPGPPDTAVSRALGIAARVRAALPMGGAPEDVGDALGSNNWAVAPDRTAAGHALLAGDPHLQLTLPSTWYEAHLAVPGVMDVAGVTFPGSPGIVIGFNRNVAWTFTNTGGDVLDYYRETVDDAGDPSRYLLDSSWVALELRPEIYRGKRGEVLAVDTVRYSHRGPLLLEGGEWVSLRWTVHDISPELEVFHRIVRAESAEDWLAAMEPYVAPTQNGLVADRHGTIAIRATGRFPIRPRDVRGDSILDGHTLASDWIGELPVNDLPFARNPLQGYLASANQEPVDPRTSGAYLGADWPAPWRAMRINALLRSDSAVTPDAMRRYQTDPGSARADAFLPALLRAGRSGPASADAQRAVTLLDEWDGRYTVENTRAVLFESSMSALWRLTWDELIPGGGTRLVAFPNETVLLALLEDSTSLWWDHRRTEAIREMRDQILIEALEEGLHTTIERYGVPEAGGWRWGAIRQANIFHLLRLPSLSARGLPVQSGPSTLSPSSGSGTHGASWRMVVELGPEIRAWGTYPGGQSGNPVSQWYTNRIPGWQAGQLDTLLFPRSVDGLRPDQVSASFSLQPKR